MKAIADPAGCCAASARPPSGEQRIFSSRYRPDPAPRVYSAQVTEADGVALIDVALIAVIGPVAGPRSGDDGRRTLWREVRTAITVGINLLLGIVPLVILVVGLIDPGGGWFGVTGDDGRVDLILAGITITVRHGGGAGVFWTFRPLLSVSVGPAQPAGRTP